jgi:uncharacterized protein YndB with AHSA1/START domain
MRKPKHTKTFLLLPEGATIEQRMMAARVALDPHNQWGMGVNGEDNESAGGAKRLILARFSPDNWEKDEARLERVEPDCTIDVLDFQSDEEPEAKEETMTMTLTTQMPGLTVSPFIATQYSQLDPLWDRVLLGTSSTTIRAYGCLLNTIASILSDLGVTIRERKPNPAILNRWMARNGGFTGGNRVVFNSVEKLGGVKLAQFIDARNRPAPLKPIAAALARGDGVAIEVDFRPGGALNQHWVRVLPERYGMNEAEVLEALKTDALIMDPWMPKGENVRWLMASYARYDWDTPETAIYRIAIYQRTEEGEAKEAASFAAASSSKGKQQEPITQAAPCLRYIPE